MIIMAVIMAMIAGVWMLVVVVLMVIFGHLTIYFGFYLK
jgi:hypothetical protein